MGVTNPFPSPDAIARAELLTRERFVYEGESIEEALAPGSARRRALDAAVEEVAAVATDLVIDRSRHRAGRDRAAVKGLLPRQSAIFTIRQTSTRTGSQLATRGHLGQVCLNRPQPPVQRPGRF